MVDTPKVTALTPSRAHGDTDDNPSPTPRISSINESDAAAAAPAAMAPQETALLSALVLSPKLSLRLRGRAKSSAIDVVAGVIGTPFCEERVERWDIQRLVLSGY
jgi:hypothetical protein